MAKALCKWKKKEIDKGLNALALIINNPKFTCKDCARSANEKAYLCKPIKLPALNE